jgi:hypothetical protein
MRCAFNFCDNLRTELGISVIVLDDFNIGDPVANSLRKNDDPAAVVRTLKTTGASTIVRLPPLLST